MPVYLFASAVFVMIAILTIHWIRGKKALEIFPDLEHVEVLFREKRVSGYANDSFINRNGGAQKVLDVIITSDELWIKSHPIFAGIGKMFNMLYKVHLNDASIREYRDHQVTLMISGDHQNTTEVVLIMKNAGDFVAVLNRQLEKHRMR